MPDVTDPRVVFIFSVLDKSGVRITDFARLTRITRATLHRWRTGGNITDNLRRDLAYTYALRLDQATTAGKLPFTNKLKKHERVTALRKIISNTSAR